MERKSELSTKRESEIGFMASRAAAASLTELVHYELAVLTLPQSAGPSRNGVAVVFTMAPMPYDHYVSFHLDSLGSRRGGSNGRFSALRDDNTD